MPAGPSLSVRGWWEALLPLSAAGASLLHPWIISHLSAAHIHLHRPVLSGCVEGPGCLEELRHHWHRWRRRRTTWRTCWRSSWKTGWVSLRVLARLPLHQLPVMMLTFTVEPTSQITTGWIWRTLTEAPSKEKWPPSSTSSFISVWVICCWGNISWASSHLHRSISSWAVRWVHGWLFCFFNLYKRMKQDPFHTPSFQRNPPTNAVSEKDPKFFKHLEFLAWNHQ